MKGAVSSIVLILIAVVVIGAIISYKPVEKSMKPIEKIVTGRATATDISGKPEGAGCEYSSSYYGGDGTCDDEEGKCKPEFLKNAKYTPEPACKECSITHTNPEFEEWQEKYCVGSESSTCQSYGSVSDEYCDDKKSKCGSGSGYVAGTSLVTCKECSTGKWKDCNIPSGGKLAAPLAKLQAPTNLQCQDVTDNIIHLSWESSSAENYRIEWCRKGLSFDSVSPTGDPADCYFTNNPNQDAWAIGLLPDTIYNFRVRSEKDFIGEWSNVIECKTKAKEIIGSGKVEKKSFYSDALGKEMPYAIYLPPSYFTTTKRYSVVYLMHETPEIWLSIGIDNQIESMIKDGTLNEMIYVMPRKGSSGLENGCSGITGNVGTITERCGNYEDYIVNDLIPYIEKKSDYKDRIIGTTESRGIIGFSSGAHGSIWLAFKYPKLFNFVSGYSGIYHRIPGVFSEIKIPDKDKLKEMKILLIVGKRDIWTEESNENFHSRLEKECGVEHDFIKIPYGINPDKLHSIYHFVKDNIKLALSAASDKLSKAY